MKTIYRGKLYDTDKAITLFSEGVYSNGNCLGESEIMVTHKGALFIYYSSTGQDLYRREQIVPVESISELQEWLNGRPISDDEIENLAPYGVFEEA